MHAYCKAWAHLWHLGMDVEARIAELDYALRQKLHPIHTVAENNALIDVELGEESIKAVHLHGAR